MHICYVMWIKSLNDSSSREMELEWVWLWVQSAAVETCGFISRASMQIDWVWAKFRNVELWERNVVSHMIFNKETHLGYFIFTIRKNWGWYKVPYYEHG